LIAGGLVLEAALLRMGYLLVRQKLPAKEPA